MIYLNENNIGVDRSIGDIQNYLFAELNPIWNNVDVYGRVYRNLDSDGGYIPEIHIGDGEYKTVYLNDNRNASVFFLVSDGHNTNDGIKLTTKVKIVFMINLKNIYGGREDSLVHYHVMNTIKSNDLGMFKVEELETGLQNVLSGYKTKSIKFKDIQPYHIFSVNGELEYFLNKC